MNVGMLWFDNDPKTALADKVQQAALFFAKKYGKQANTCLVCLAEFGDEGLPAVDKIQVHSRRIVPKGHLWIGVEEVK